MSKLVQVLRDYQMWMAEGPSIGIDDIDGEETFGAAADRIEELEAENARLETEAKLQAEEIDKTRRRADKWQSMVLDCGEYLKPGETPVERIEREIDDCLALMKLLEKKQMRIQELEAKLAKAVEALKKLNVGEGWAAQIARTTLAELKGAEDESA